MIEETLEKLVCTESENGTWEIVTDPLDKSKLTLLHFKEEYERPTEIRTNIDELKDLIKFLDRLQK